MSGSLIFLLFLVGAILLQAITSIVHVKYYKKMVNETAEKFRDGYLGVGMTKKALRPGKVAIVVTDNEGTIRECNILSGLLVLSRFHNYQEYVGEAIESIDWEQKRHKLVIQNAIDQVKIQMNKQPVG